MTNIIDLIERTFAYGDGRKKDAHWPSEVTDCPRKIVYKWLKTPETNPIDATGYWRINIGNAIHELCQVRLGRVADDPDMVTAVAWPGFTAATEVRSGEVPISGLDYPVRFRVDLVITDSDMAKAIVEIKSAFGRGMGEIKRNGPKDSALMQTIIYLALSTAISPEGISRAYVMYVSRDNADRVLFCLEAVGEEGFRLSRMFPGGEAETMRTFSPKVFGNAIERFRMIEGLVASGELPERPYTVAIKGGEIREQFQKAGRIYRSDWHCMYCQYLQRCWEERAREWPEPDNSGEFFGKEEEVGQEV